MKNIDRADHISEIIEQWFNKEFENEADEERVKQLFFDWLASEEDTEEKERVVERLMANDTNIPNDDSIKRSYDRYTEFIESQGGFSQESRPIKVKKSISLGKRLMRVAAVVIPLLVVGVGIWHFGGRMDDGSQQYVHVYDVNNGEIDNVKLPDSTQIKINSGSKLDVKFEMGSRSIELNGEAYFDVARDEKRPFIVQTEDVTVRVLGTKFNIEAYSERNLAIVLLVEGRISLVESSGKEWNLEPNQLFVYNKNKGMGSIQNLTNEEIADMGSWSEGRAVYNYRTIEDIFGIIERRFAVDIKIQPGVELASTEYMIQIDPDETAEMIIEAFGALTEKFTYRIVGDEILILPPNR